MNKLNPLVVSTAEKIFSKVSSSIEQLREEYDSACNLYQKKAEKLTHAEASLQLSLKDIASLNEQATRLEDNLFELQGRYALLCSAVSPERNRCERYDAFRKILDQQLLPFINGVNVLKNEAEQMLKIGAVDNELRLASSLQVFAERTIVAVAGGFSSGKSSFISSLFAKGDVKLPIGIEPVTAIPTYVFHNDELNISGYPVDGGRFSIPQGIYDRLSHKFVEEFGFNLRDLMPFISLEVPMAKCRNIAFIDLPGYNPGKRDGLTSDDKAISSKFITQAQAMIWMIGLDANGTIPADDLAHLEALAGDEVPLYIVLNKADLRPLETIDEVLDVVDEELDIANIPYQGICAYSSQTGEEINHLGQSLEAFLSEFDRPRDKSGSIYSKLDEVLDAYEEALNEQIKLHRGKLLLIKSLELNLLELGAFDSDDSTDFCWAKYFEEDEEGTVVSSLNQEEVSTKHSHRELEVEKNKDNLINAVRDQIQGLREDFQVNDLQKSRQDLINIRTQLSEAFLLK